ncbi:MAG: SGNH/GDSL hydrolase family protein, partial [Verrucomicrobiales bacterium]|nr:SGNH/GDSL hydrolase family protein [Verrucomicrobiales bacterium]
MKNFSIFPLIACIALLANSSAFAETAVTLKKGDRIVYIGNSLADRMQHDGWLETILQNEFADQELVIRNLGFSGDQVNNRPRNRGFTAAEDFFKHIGTDVIFVYFGYNESFKGEGGVEGFKKDLGAMIDKYRALKPNGESEPRIVLFSPIAHENLKPFNPALSNGKANNTRLALYTKAIADVASAKNTGFVDIFGPSQALYEANKEPLTINGVHLNEEGNRQLAEVMAKGLTGLDLKASPELESLREAVIDKNFHWYNRYRATDGNDIWGGRSTLKFVDDQTNAEVLQHELVMFDAMAANRDKRIHALARGSDFIVDDKNVPKPIPVISNVGGGSKSSNPDKEGSLEYVSGEEGISKIEVADGFEVGLYADETMDPGLVNPVQMQV